MLCRSTGLAADCKKKLLGDLVPYDDQHCKTDAESLSFIQASLRTSIFVVGCTPDLLSLL